MTRRLVSAVLILLVLALAWSGGWYWLAGWTGRQVPEWLTQASEAGVDVNCPNREVTGFPFALKVACGETAVVERESGTNTRLGGLTGGMSVFAPTTAEIALASPARVESPIFAEPAEIRWQDATIDLAMGMGGPRDVSFDATDMHAAFRLSDHSDPVIVAARAGGALGPSQAGGSNAALTFTELVVSVEGATFPPVSGGASGHLSLPPSAFMAGPAGLEGPLAANNIDVSLESGGAKLQALGDVAVDDEGVVDGTITLRVAGANALPAFIEALPPNRQQIGNAIVGAIFAFGRQTTLDGEAASELVIEVERGEARVGPVEIRVPRLKL